MVLGRSTSLQLTKIDKGSHQKIKIVESMDIDDTGPMIHKCPNRNASPLTQEFLHQTLCIDPHTFKVWYQTNGDGHI
jgi:hypothetical protein